MKSYFFRCSGCGTRNRIPEDRAGQPAKCGKCGGRMETSALKIAHPVMVTDANFTSTVLQSPMPVLLDCWAQWCGPCQIMGPVMDELAATWQGRIRVGKLNIDQNPRIAGQFFVRSVPTLLVFDRGKLLDTLVGAVPKHQIIQKMAGYL
ncbi:MAG: thioredoxin [Thermodesulfobacteriota bacterium]